MSKFKKGHKYFPLSEEGRIRKQKRMLGDKNPSKRIEVRVRSGENSTNWKGGITPINYKIRNSLEYKLWRKAVFQRDNYTCVWCKKRGGYLEADHIKPFALYPELRFSIDNGRTLCRDCHNTTKYGRPKKI